MEKSYAYHDVHIPADYTTVLKADLMTLPFWRWDQMNGKLGVWESEVDAGQVKNRSF